jgi:hypothetical protein
MRQAELLLEQDGRGLSLRADLAGGGAGGVGGLQRVAAADGAVAALAAAAVDVDLAAQRFAGQVNLELAIDVGFDEVAEAVRTAGRQGGLGAFVDGAVGGRAMAVAAVLGAAFATRPFGMRHGRPLGEGSGLAFAGALGLFELTCELLQLGFEFGQAALEDQTVGTELRHVASIRKRLPISCARLQKNQRDGGPLINYDLAPFLSADW